MKILVFILILFLYSNILFSEDLTIEINNNLPLYSNKELSMIIYYIPFSVDTFRSLDIEAVKGSYFAKIEIQDDIDVYKFIQNIKNTKYEIIDNNIGDLRCVIEFFYDNRLIFSYCLDNFNVFINGNKIKKDMIFYRVLLIYLPKKYEYDIEFIN